VKPDPLRDKTSDDEECPNHLTSSDDEKPKKQHTLVPMPKEHSLKTLIGCEAVLQPKNAAHIHLTGPMGLITAAEDPTRRLWVEPLDDEFGSQGRWLYVDEASKDAVPKMKSAGVIPIVYTPPCGTDQQPKGMILVLCKTGKSWDYGIDMPKGHCKIVTTSHGTFDVEAKRTTARRETREETGLDIEDLFPARPSDLTLHTMSKSVFLKRYGFNVIKEYNYFGARLYGTLAQPPEYKAEPGALCL